MATNGDFHMATDSRVVMSAAAMAIALTSLAGCGNGTKAETKAAKKPVDRPGCDTARALEDSWRAVLKGPDLSDPEFSRWAAGRKRLVDAALDKIVAANPTDLESIVTLKEGSKAMDEIATGVYGRGTADMSTFENYLQKHCYV